MLTALVIIFGLANWVMFSYNLTWRQPRNYETAALNGLAVILCFFAFVVTP